MLAVIAYAPFVFFFAASIFNMFIEAPVIAFFAFGAVAAFAFAIEKVISLINAPPNN